MHGVGVWFLLVAILGYSRARPENINAEINDLYTEIGVLSEDESLSEVEKMGTQGEELDEDDREEFEGRAKYDDTFDDDPNIKEIEAREYETVMGRIVDVNLAHWVKRQEQSKQGAMTKRETEENVEGKIETTNEENGFFFDQGDMIVDCELFEQLHPGESCKRGGSANRKKRNALRSRKRLWTSRTIPYKVPPYMSDIRDNLNTAIQNFHRSTCLRFVPYNRYKHKNYIYFANDKGCSSKVGKRYAEPGGQKVSLGKGCNFVGTITHELLHAIGFFHEQARDDRDRFVEVKWENILDGFSSQFDKYGYETIDKVGKDYDFLSIMHYDRRAFTKNGLNTIERIGSPSADFGNTQKTLSAKDIEEIDALYQCKTTKYYGWSQWSAFMPCDKTCKKERERFCYNSGDVQACGGNVNVYGIEKQKVDCGKHECPVPVNGHWSRWSDWSDCDVSCDDGKMTRFRKCNNPTPGHGGKFCAGNVDEEGVCTMRRCTLGYEDTDFDKRNPLGMWKNIGKIPWRVNKGFTQTMDTGPSRDHTTGTGYYLYMESSGTERGSRAIIQSPWLPSPRGGQCMKFFYTMFGKSMGSLWITLKQNGKSTTIFSKSGDQGIYWEGAKASIDVPEGQKFQVEIYAQTGNGEVGYSDIAIDDVYFDHGLCDCQDDYVTCPKWKTAGDCKRKVKFMSKHCAKSCETCECKDANENCPAWAAQPNGCHKNRAYMRLNCKKSCKICHPPKGFVVQAHGKKRPKMCKDGDTVQCPAWKKLGECTKNPGYMSVKCPLSCGKCVCNDKNAGCPKWAKEGQCTANKGWMLDNCFRSCHVCVCGDNHQKCGLWAKLGECNKNKDFMTEHCKKSCSKC